MQEEPDPRGKAYDSGNKEGLVWVPFHVRVLGGVICTRQHSRAHQKGSRPAGGPAGDAASRHAGRRQQNEQGAENRQRDERGSLQWASASSSLAAPTASLAVRMRSFFCA